MSGDDAYDMLLRQFESNRAPEAQGFFSGLRKAYGIAHVVYAVFSVSPDGLGRHRVIHDFEHGGSLLHTHAVGDASRMPRELLEAIAPLEMSAGRLIAALAALGEPTRRLSANEHALVFPLPGPSDQRAFLAVIWHKGGDWTTVRQALVRDLPSLAAFFHAAQISPDSDNWAQPESEVRLTPREREVLEWVAAGKSYWEISVILGISQRTVRHFMASSRTKLDAVSNKQAIAQAIVKGLIGSPIFD